MQTLHQLLGVYGNEQAWDRYACITRTHARLGTGGAKCHQAWGARPTGPMPAAEAANEATDRYGPACLRPRA